MKYEKGRTYTIHGNQVFINNQGCKVVQLSELERKPHGQELAERLNLSHKHKTTDIYKGVYYSKKISKSWITFYIDENYNALSKEIHKNIIYCRASVSSIVADKITNDIRIYYNLEFINQNQELTTRKNLYMVEEVGEGFRFTDQAILKIALEKIKTLEL